MAPKDGSSPVNPIIAWALILYLPSSLIFVIVTSGGLADWVPLYPDGWGMIVFLGFNVGYALLMYPLVWRYARKKNMRISIQLASPPTPNPDGPAKSN